MTLAEQKEENAQEHRNKNDRKESNTYKFRCKQKGQERY
jgi:hypothetical protein